jgi:branched-chain amino acid transport system substrate-binding protein
MLYSIIPRQYPAEFDPPPCAHPIGAGETAERRTDTPATVGVQIRRIAMHHPMRNASSSRLVALFAAVLAFVALAARADLSVGITVSATGPAAALGGPQKNTAALLPAEIAGQKVKYIVLDDGTDPTNAIKNARKLVTDDRVDIILGATTTANSLAVLTVAAESEVPMISLAPFQPPPDKLQWAFQTPQANTLMASVVVDHMKANGVKSVGYIGFSDPFGESWFGAFKPLIDQAGINLVATERYNRTDTSVTAQVLKIVAANPDAVMIGASGTPAVLPHLGLAERAYKGRIYHTHGIVNKAVLTLGGPRLDGAFVPMGPGMVAETLPDSHPSKKPALEYAAAYEKANGADSRTTFGAHLWDAMLIVRAALPEALKAGMPGTPQFRKALRDAIEKVREVPATQGVFTYTATDHVGLDNRARVLTRIEAGTWKLVGAN